MKSIWMRTIWVLTMVLGAMTAGAAATGDDLWVITAGRTPGAAGSVWVTDLFVTNTSEEEVEVEIALVRQGDDPEAEGPHFRIAAGETRVFLDVIQTTFGLGNALGAIHVDVVEEDEEASSFTPDQGRLAARARIFNQTATGTFGQSVDAVPESEAISANGEAASAVVGGVRNDATFRSNWFAVNLTEDAAETAQPATVRAELLGATGNVIASKEYALLPASPIFIAAGDLAPSFENATLRFTMLSGTALFGASLIDSRTNDPTTLPANRRAAHAAPFTDEFRIADCTFISTGDNPYFPLQPGAELVLEGEDEDGETVTHTIEVLDETRIVNGVETRVVVEDERVDDEPVEISRNFFAQCQETGSVFYFGEEVDIYEDGEIVSHDGAWLAGQNGARPGIIMPGTVLAGSRYYQEVAPGVALDRTEHLATGVTVTTPAGTFTNCLAVRDSTPLDPLSTNDVKYYCPGIGIVKDKTLELIEREEP